MKVFIELLKSCETKRSEKDNGYFIVSGFWNTCFHRWMKNPDKTRIEIRANSNPVCYHTYTKVPKTLEDHVWFVYVNANQQESLIIKGEVGDKIVGMYEPQFSGKYLNWAFLVYSPAGKKPVIDTKPTDCVPDVIVQTPEKTYELKNGMLVPDGWPVKYINPGGSTLTKKQLELQHA